MKILLIAGHGAGDSGAIGINGVHEKDLTRNLVYKIRETLKQYTNVYVYPTERNAYADVQANKIAVNFKDYDYVFEVHFNAFNGSAYGTECFTTTMESGITVEQKVMEKMSKYFKLRDNDSIYDGVKRTNFSVISTAKNMGTSSALLETCFIDNKSDMDIYNAKFTDIAKDIALGLAEGFGLTEGTVPIPQPIPQPIVPQPDQILEVGSNVVFDNMTVTAVDIPNQWVYIPTIGGWIPSSLCVEIGGTNAIDNVLDVGSVCKIEGTYTVVSIQGQGTNNVKINHPQMNYWINANALIEV